MAPLQSFCPINLANPEEPLCYLVPHYKAKRNRLNRVLATTEQILTFVKLKIISDRVLTDPLIDLVAQNLLEIEYRKHPLLDLTFDDGNQQRLLDLRPLIPIVLRY